MLTSQPISTRGKPQKLLRDSLVREEAKTPEIEEAFQCETIKETQETEKEELKESELTDTKAEKELQKDLFLSQRALKVKQGLNKTEEIEAVLLKSDGSQQQIKLNASSKQINKILNGRPAVVGELEEINVLILRLLNQANGDFDQKQQTNELNKNILPPPFCNEEFYGSYLLFRVNSNGSPTSLSLKEYQIFVDAKKDLIEQQRKNYNSIENRQIKVKSTFDSDSKLTLVYLRSEVDKKLRAEFENKNGRNPTNSEIEDFVNKSLQNLVDNLVSEMSVNRMIDPDYEIENDLSIDPNYQPTERERKQAEREKEYTARNEWRKELDEALNYVRQKGKFDGGVLAERIAQTFYETNGVEPTLDELIEIFTKIKSKYLNVDDVESDSNILNLKMLKTPRIKSKTGIAETYNLYFNKLNKKRKNRNLLMAIKSFEKRNKRKPNEFEINRLKQFLSTNNKTTKIRFKLTVVDEDEEKELEEKKENIRTTRSKLLVTPVKKKKNAAKFNVYFNENNENKNEDAAVKWFKRFNDRKPTEIELNLIKHFVQCDEKEQLTEYGFDVPIYNKPNKAANTDSDDSDSVKIKHKIHYETDSVIRKKSSTKYILNFNDEKERESGNEKHAIKWFSRFNNRQPTDVEKQNIKQFVQNGDQNIIDID